MDFIPHDASHVIFSKFIFGEKFSTHVDMLSYKLIQNINNCMWQFFPMFILVYDETQFFLKMPEIENSKLFGF